MRAIGGSGFAFSLLLLSCGSEPAPRPGSIGFEIRARLTQPAPAVAWEVRDAERIFMETVELYESRGFEPIWVDDDGLTGRGEAVLDVIRRAPEQGLRAGDYLVGTLSDESHPEDLARLDAETAARVDITLSYTTMRFIKDLHEGRFSPRDLQLGLDIMHDHKDLTEELEKLAASEDPVGTLQSYAPAYPEYDRLRRALATYQTLAEDDPWQTMRADETLHPGELYDDIELLRRRLRFTGDLPEDAVSRGSAYEGALVEAVERFQTRHSLNAEGVIGEHTFAELNTPWSDRVAQIVASMERWRWVPENIDGTPILANVPEFRLRAGELLDHTFRVDLDSRIIVGQAYHRFQTPLFTGKLSYIDFRPYWNVPLSIVQRELSGDLDEPGYFDKHDYEIVGSTDLDATPLPITPENIERVRTGGLRLRQRPGPSNALGLVKFIFPNEHSVFLHSTPARSLFQRDKRAFSHGCIRVDRATDLAEWVLKGQEGWDRLAIEKAMASGPTKRVFVERNIPVFVLYLTAFVGSESDGVHFGHDIYGLDAELAHALGREFIDLDHQPTIPAPGSAY